MSTTELSVQTPVIDLNGSALSTALMYDLIDVRVEQTVGLPSRLSLRFFDSDFEHIDGSALKVGDAIVVKFLNQQQQPVKVFDGLILDIGLDTHGDQYILEVGALDYSCKLDGSTQTRTFLNMTRTQMIKKIAQEVGLVSRVQDTKVRYPHVMQSTTNRAFIDELVALEGLEWWVDGKTLVVGDRSQAAGPVVRNGEDLIRCSARFARRAGKGTVKSRGWDRKAKRAIVGQAPLNHDAAVGGADSTFASGFNGQSVSAGSAYTLVVAPHVADDPAEAAALANGYANRLLAGEVTLRGEAIGNPELRAPGKVKVENMGQRVSGTYYLTTVEHVFGAERPYLTRFTAGGREPTRVVDLLSTRGSTVGPVPLGLTIGIVTNNNDPDGMGRVKVKFPILADEVESAWARVITPASGSSTGFFFVPEINDEVLVGFEHADLRHPVVLGGLWNGLSKPPVSASEAVKSAKVATWVVKTRTGNILQFFDGNSATEARIVVTHANTKNKVTIENQRIEIAAEQPGSAFAVKVGTASITISDKGDITLDGNNITLKSKAKIAIEGLTLEAKGSTTAKFECNGQGLNVNPATTTLKGSAMAQIQAPMVKVN